MSDWSRLEWLAPDPDDFDPFDDEPMPAEAEPLSADDVKLNGMDDEAADFDAEC